MTADNITIDNETRNELVNLVNLGFIESYHNTYVEANQFYKAKDIENLNTGLGNLSKPYTDENGFWNYETEFSATSGHFTTPYFGGRYDPLKYKFNVDYYYTIKIPKEATANYTEVMEIQMDLTYDEDFPYDYKIIQITPGDLSLIHI